MRQKKYAEKGNATEAPKEWRVDFPDYPQFAGSPLMSARILLNAQATPLNLDSARKLLKSICRKWPAPLSKVNILSTCGGFVSFPWPCGVEKKSIVSAWNTPDAFRDQLKASAGDFIQELLGNGLQVDLARRAKYLTLGVDSRVDTHSASEKLSVELVCVIDLEKGKLDWTGKFYPTCKQERALVRWRDLESHFLTLGGVKVMVLGCHDLTVFHPRSIAKLKRHAPRWNVSKEFRRLAESERPKWVIQHPHTTVKTRTWSQAWKGLNERLPDVECWYGTGAYSECDKGWDQKDDFENVREATKKGPVLDVIARANLEAA